MSRRSQLLKLQARVDRLTEALSSIAHPVMALKAQLGPDEKLDGAAAFALSNDPQYLKDIAKQALEALEEELYAPTTKVIFLDIDEVLNTLGSREGFDQGRCFDPTAVKLLRQIMDTTGAKLVISSTWRKGADYLSMAHLLSLVGLGENCLYTAPKPEGMGSLPFKNDGWRTEPVHDNPRGALIQQWLETYGQDITHYVILDDDRDMLPEQMDHFVHVDGVNGFTFRDYLWTLKVLGESPEREILRPFRGVGINNKHGN